jgi:hypothetical protein
MFDLMQYALIFYDFQLILARMGMTLGGRRGGRSVAVVAEASSPLLHLSSPPTVWLARLSLRGRRGVL